MKKNNMAQNKRNGKNRRKIKFHKTKVAKKKKRQQKKMRNFSFNLHSFLGMSIIWGSDYLYKYQIVQIPKTQVLVSKTNS